MTDAPKPANCQDTETDATCRDFDTQRAFLARHPTPICDWADGANTALDRAFALARAFPLPTLT